MRNVGQISYVNVAPYFHFWRDESLAFVKGPPRQLGHLAREGRIDLAALPLFDTFRLEETFEPLGQFGIAATRKVMSVFLFSQRPIEALDGSLISLTTDSSTSVNLLKLLLREKYKFGGIRFAELGRTGETSGAGAGSFPSGMLSDDDAPAVKLLIGDQALKEADGSTRWPFVYDLATEWYQWTSLPFTFARWVVRRGIDPAERRRFAETLAANLEQAFSRLEELCAAEEAKTGIDRSLLLPYLKNLTFSLGPAEEEGMKLFRSKAQRAGLL